VDLILWRHAEAEPGEPDLGRRLTSKGLKQAERMGDWLDLHLPGSARILASPADRAQQTALGLKRKFKTVDDLAPAAPVAALLAAANWPAAREPVVIIGHQPTLGAVASFLLAGNEANWPVRKGAVWWLSNRDRSGPAAVVLRVAIGPDFVWPDQRHRPVALPRTNAPFFPEFSSGRRSSR
jgi:phosphohistidine phosphatase